MDVTLDDFNETNLVFECIETEKMLIPYFGSGEAIEWSLNTNEGTLTNVENGETIAPVGGCQNNASLSKNKLALLSVFNLISTAFAEDTPELIEELEASTSYDHRNARSQLAEKEILVVEPLLDKLSSKQLSYHSRLGIIVAITEMMRQNKPHRDEIIQKIKNEYFEPLLDAVVDEDKTIRIYASEFLYDLGDPRIISLALDRFSSANEDGRYNLLVVIKGAVPYIQENEIKINIIQRITALKSEETPKTNLLIDSIIDL